MLAVRRALFSPNPPVLPRGALSVQPGAVSLQVTDPELHRRHVERTRQEAQLAAFRYEEERMRTKQIQREAVLDFVKVPSFSTYLMLRIF